MKNDRAGLFIEHSINFRLNREHWWAVQSIMTNLRRKCDVIPTFRWANWRTLLLEQKQKNSDRYENWNYRKNSKIWDTSNNCHNCHKNRKVWCNIALMHPKDADGMANSIYPDQAASSEAVHRICTVKQTSCKLISFNCRYILIHISCRGTFVFSSRDHSLWVRNHNRHIASLYILLYIYRFDKARRHSPTAIINHVFQLRTHFSRISW